MRRIFTGSCIMVLVFALFGCATATNHPVEKAGKLVIGQSKDDVLKIMGPTPMRDYHNDESVLQWCKTGRSLFRGGDSPPDRFVDAYFFQDKLTKIKTYTSNLYGDCSNFFHPAEWEQP